MSDTLSQSRSRAAAISAVALVLVLSPVRENFRDDPVDGFPLSYFPMFTARRDGRTSVAHPIGIRRDGSEVNLEYTVVAGGGMNEVRRQINLRVDDDKADSLCRAVARKVGRSSRAEYGDIVEVAIVTDRYVFEQFFHGDRAPATRQVHARRAVSRAKQE